MILSDVMMPEMDGYELTKVIKSSNEYKGIPVILLTAREDIEMKIHGLEYGADDYIQKPFNTRELRARIKTKLKMKNLRDELEEQKIKLENTQNQLIKQEKLASLGALTAGIAHEIKNPLNFVTNFAEVSNELIQEAKEKIFEPFFTTKPTRDGLGLGLSICYDIVFNGHNGYLYVESEKDSYAEFTIKLPKGKINTHKPSKKPILNSF